MIDFGFYFFTTLSGYLSIGYVLIAFIDDDMIIRGIYEEIEYEEGKILYLIACLLWCFILAYHFYYVSKYER